MSLSELISTVITRDPFLAVIIALVVWWVLEEWLRSS